MLVAHILLLLIGATLPLAVGRQGLPSIGQWAFANPLRSSALTKHRPGMPGVKLVIYSLFLSSNIS